MMTDRDEEDGTADIIIDYYDGVHNPYFATPATRNHEMMTLINPTSTSSANVATTTSNSHRPPPSVSPLFSTENEIMNNNNHHGTKSIATTEKNSNTSKKIVRTRTSLKHVILLICIVICGIGQGFLSNIVQHLSILTTSTSNWITTSGDTTTSSSDDEEEKSQTSSISINPQQQQQEQPITLSLEEQQQQEDEEENILVTGAAGFLGMHTILQLVGGVNDDENSRSTFNHHDQSPNIVVGLDNFNSMYYPNDIKYDRLNYITSTKQQGSMSTSLSIEFIKGDVCNRTLVEHIITRYNITTILHFASDEGSRGVSTGTSNANVQRPFRYPLNNEDCMVDLLELLKVHHRPTRLVGSSSGSQQFEDHKEEQQQIRFMYVSSSRSYRQHSHHRVSTHGTAKDDEGLLLSNDDNTEVLRSNELLAHVYHTLYNVSSIGIRLPTVWGLYGRPDMSYWKWMTTATMMHSFSNQTTNIITEENDLLHETNHYMYVKDAVNEMLNVLYSSDESSRSALTINKPSMIWSSKRHGGMQTIITLPQQNEIVHSTNNNDSDIHCSRLISGHMLHQLITQKEQQYNNGGTTNHGAEEQPSTKATTISSTTDCHKDHVSTMIRWFHQYNNNNNELREDEENELNNSNDDNDAPDPRNICFVTSMFSTDVEHCDSIMDLSNYTQSKFTDPSSNEPLFQYYFFTNLDNLVTPGWDKIIMKDLPFRRMITESRWPKFMGWQHPLIEQHCKTVIYSDANIPPKDLSNDPTTWIHLSDTVHNKRKAKLGLLQRPNVRVNRKRKMTILEELERLLKNKKDIPVNVNATREWFLQQHDFHDDVKGYWNMILIYDPANPRLQRLMSLFWSQYSNEETSWRDQPLWRYLVDAKLSYDEKPLLRENLDKYFHSKSGTHNRHGHKYDSQDDANAGSITSTTTAVVVTDSDASNT